MTHMKLNKDQLAVVQHFGTPLLVSAGPGSGKTRVLIERIKFLLQNGLKPSEILCLTFSEKAASELKERLETDDEIRGKIDISEMQISTYHSFCRNLLLENTIHTGLGMRGGILDRSVFLVWGVQNIDKFGFDDHIEIGNNASELVEKMIDGISVFNDELITPADLEKYVNEKKGNIKTVSDAEETEYLHMLDNLVKIYKEYDKFKKEIDVMDYDDLIVEANKILSNKAKPQVLRTAQEKYKHILIDEFQDNNFAQFSIVKSLVKDGNVTAVGDDDQNIYRFQGAYTQIFDDFRKTFPDHTEVLLSQNYRNPPSVINFSGQLMVQDKFRNPKKIEPVKKNDTKVNVVECASDFAQAEFVKNKIQEILGKNPDYEFKDFAILSRKQKDGLNVAQILASEGIPVQYIGKSQVHGSPSAKVLFSILRVISDPMNSLTNITRILQEYGITEQNISKINHEATVRARGKNNGDYAFDVLSDLNVEDLTQKTELAEIYKMITSFIDLAKNSTPSQTIYKLIRNKTNIYKKIANDDSIENFIERSILNDIINSSYDFEKIQPKATIKEFLRFVDELEKFDIETKRDTTDSNAVLVSTIHKSKGLEFKAVFIIDVATYKMPLRYNEKPFYVPHGLEKGVRPKADPKEEFLREERRIFYVGMTRAIDHLFITYPTQYENREKANKASKFLQELDPEKNPNVNFQKYDSVANTKITTTFDAVEIIKNEKIEQAITHLSSNQYASAIQKIIDLSKIEYFQKNKTTEGFSAESLLPKNSSREIDESLNGTITKLGFTKRNLSFTKFDEYEKCPKMFWYKHVLNALPENQEAPALSKGSTFHEIVEESAKRQQEGQIDSADTLLKSLESKWTSEGYLTQPIQKENQDKESLKPALKSYQKWSSTNPNKIVGLEIPFTIHIGDYQVDGFIDRLEQTPDGEYVVVDYKTGGKNKKISKVWESLQLNIYCMAIKEKKEFGKLPKKAMFFYVEKPEDEQFFVYDVDPDQVEAARQKLEDYVKAIRNKEFDATPEMFTCRFCSYADICNDALED